MTNRPQLLWECQGDEVWGYEVHFTHVDLVAYMLNVMTERFHSYFTTNPHLVCILCVKSLRWVSGSGQWQRGAPKC